MNATYISGIILIGIAVVIECSVASERRETLCSIPAAKRMLETIGIASTSDCLLKRKRDVNQLVASYLEKKAKTRESNLLDAVETLLDENRFVASKRGQYCCSPGCDRFMKRLGNPTTDVLQCV